ncbi:phage tail protein [Streptomyces althioticus]
MGPALATSNGIRPGAGRAGVGRSGVEADDVGPGAGPVSGGGIASGTGPVGPGTAGAGPVDPGTAGARRAGGLPAELRLRAAVAAAARLHRVRGTRRGLSEAVRLVFGVPPEIRESGAAAWHARPLGPVPGDRRPHLHVTLRLPDPTPADHHRLDTLVAAARPAHMPYTVEVVASAVAERTTDR